jgi:hypothetical protein
MKTALRTALVILSVVSVLGAWAGWGSQGAAGAALWNAYDPVGEVKPPSGAPDPQVRGVEEYGGYVYLLTRDGMLYTYDARDLPGRSTFATYSEPVASLNVDSGSVLLRNGPWLYACGGSGLVVLDLANPTQPSMRVPADGAGRFYNIFRKGDRLFLAGRDKAVIYSLADPSHPSVLGSYEAIGKSFFAAAAYGDTMYLSELTSGVSGGVQRTVDISDPPHPVSLGTVTLAELPYHYRLLGDRLFSGSSNSVSLWSLANPGQPQLLDTHEASARVCAVDGDNVVTSRRVFRPDGDLLVEVATFASEQSQHAGFPYGSAAGSGFVFLAEHMRALMLKGVSLPEAWPYQIRLPLVKSISG